MLSETPFSKLFEPERITLEPLTAAHAAELFPLLADRRVYQFSRTSRPSLLPLLLNATSVWSRGVPRTGLSSG